MAARKLQQEIDKCFKKVGEGVAEFDGIYEKIEQSNNPAQKEKLEDNLKREIKKLQRLRDQIKTWAASNDIKDKGPLLEQRKLIETQMERFKAVEKAMKTKAYSKEGLSAATKLDPKEQAKMDTIDFLSSQVDELERQIEALETESTQIAATKKKSKSHAAQDRVAQIDHTIERHKFHQGKLELIRRSLENGGVDTEQVNDIEESIRYYVTSNGDPDFMEDEELYEDLDLQEEEDVYGIPHENDRVSSQDTQSVQEEIAEPEPRPSSLPGKPRSAVDANAASGRRPSAQLKSPLPTLATLHQTPSASSTNGTSSGTSMKPASLPQRPAGEGLKYASAAAAAAASDKNNVGIAPLPPPPGSQPIASQMGISPLPPAAQAAKTSAASSPSTASIQPVALSEPKPGSSSVPSALDPKPSEQGANFSSTSRKEKGLKSTRATAATEQAAESSRAAQTNGVGNGAKGEEEESIYHLPAVLGDLVDSFDVAQKRSAPINSMSHLRMMTASQANVNLLDTFDTEPTRTYKPDVRYPSASGYPQEPLPIFEDPRLYSRIEPDTLFYVFYYKQGTYQQYLAAKALKDQSWRFHKQYQTWFQRHEEPKNITEEFEQGTYRFFDYESTWMNRRKADFKFAYRFLEDDV
ncbi:Not1 N-terminal domain, CCR4-Not complex component-domain-containing protein [Xylariaceae sp. FL0016]|nr:Not1 N-terminal domain, CCR4-Not complex component-domain-containing protein [Xylariaceae sp. FL0016]